MEESKCKDNKTCQTRVNMEILPAVFIGETKGYCIYQNDNKCDSERDKSATEMLSSGLILEFGAEERQCYDRGGYCERKENEITEAPCWCLTVKSTIWQNHKIIGKV